MTLLQEGQSLALTTDEAHGAAPLTKVRLGLGWDKYRTAGFAGSGAPDVDLDASALQFSGTQLFDLAFYNNLSTRDGSTTHLGDNQSGSGKGDDEAITVDLTRVYGKVDTILFLVTSYQGHGLEWTDNAYVRLVDETRDDEEVARFTLTQGVKETGLLMAALQRDPARPTHWSLRAIGAGIAAKLPTEAVAAVQRFL